MTTRDPTVRPFPELEQVKRAALTYAWAMLYLGIGVGFVLAWLMCSVRACERPREPVAPVPATASPSGSSNVGRGSSSPELRSSDAS